jgi:serine/threonine-protein kinase
VVKDDREVDATPLDAPEPHVVGRYAIHGKIASGGMASVHFGRLAGVAGFSRTVAVKRLHAHLAQDPSFRSTMIDEARLAARIHHPNVVSTIDIVLDNGELLLVMEYVRGESLARLLRTESERRRRAPRAIASAIILGALHGLHAAHEATSDRGTPLGIVHRDVSPQNILVGVDGVARVIDFGIAKAAGRIQMTTEGAVKGKLAYMAPEQLASGDNRLATGEVTRAADIYAVGALLWEILAGRRLFTGENDAQRAIQVLLGAKDPPSRYAPNVPPLLDALVMKALAFDPADRFATAMEMAEELRRVVVPAFSTDVGRWVDDVASKALARRGAELADIERIAGPPDDLQTVSSQPSSLSVETPRNGPAGSSPRRLTKAAGALALLVVTAAAVAMFRWRVSVIEEAKNVALVAGKTGGANVVLDSNGPPTSSSAAAAEPVTSSLHEARRPDDAVATGAAPPSSATAASPIPPRNRVPSRPRSKPRPAIKTVAPFRFEEPD